MLVTSINGRLVRRGSDKISVFDNSLLYAEGLFETCLAVGSRVIFLNEHLSRLLRGAKIIGLKIPVSRKRLAEWIDAATAAHRDRIKKVRLTVTSGEAARWVGRQGAPQVIVSVAPHTVPTRPFRLHLSEFRVDQQSVFRHIKTISYAIHAAALRQAISRRCDDALLLNEKGEIAEVTSANIFWVRRGRIFTPPLSSGCLDGVTRRKVIALAARDGLSVVERNIRLERLATVDELFICSSLKLVVGVDSVRAGRRKYKFSSGPVTELIRNRFLRMVAV